MKEGPHIFASQAQLCTHVCNSSCRGNHLQKHLQVIGRGVMVVSAGVQGTIVVIKRVIVKEKMEYASFLMVEQEKKNDFMNAARE